MGGGAMRRERGVMEEVIVESSVTTTGQTPSVSVTRSSLNCHVEDGDRYCHTIIRHDLLSL